MKRIQSEQSRALNKMVFENNYPMKIKGLIDELKNSKDKIKEIEEHYKTQIVELPSNWGDASA